MVNWGDSRLPERFWEKVLPEPNSGCWLWTGYTQFKWGGDFPTFNLKGKKIGVRRLVYETVIAQKTNSKDQIRQTCGVDVCCNPEHLKLRVSIPEEQRDARYQAMRSTWKRKYKNKMRGYRLKAEYGIDEERFIQMLAQQDGRCAICADDFAGLNYKPHIDHSHATGEIRMLLCRPCNAGLGSYRDRPDLLRAAAAYLERHAAKTKAA